MKVSFNCSTIVNWTFEKHEQLKDKLKTGLEFDWNIQSQFEIINYYSVLLVNCDFPDSGNFEFDSIEDKHFLEIIFEKQLCD